MKCKNKKFINPLTGEALSAEEYDKLIGKVEIKEGSFNLNLPSFKKTEKFGWFKSALADKVFIPEPVVGMMNYSLDDAIQSVKRMETAKRRDGEQDVKLLNSAASGDVVTFLGPSRSEAGRTNIEEVLDGLLDAVDEQGAVLVLRDTDFIEKENSLEKDVLNHFEIYSTATIAPLEVAGHKMTVIYGEDSKEALDKLNQRVTIITEKLSKAEEDTQEDKKEDITISASPAVRSIVSRLLHKIGAERVVMAGPAVDAHIARMQHIEDRVAYYRYDSMYDIHIYVDSEAYKKLGDKVKEGIDLGNGRKLYIHEGTVPDDVSSIEVRSVENGMLTGRILRSVDYENLAPEQLLHYLPILDITGKKDLVVKAVTAKGFSRPEMFSAMLSLLRLGINIKNYANIFGKSLFSLFPGIADPNVNGFNYLHRLLVKSHRFTDEQLAAVMLYVQYGKYSRKLQNQLADYSDIITPEILAHWKNITAVLSGLDAVKKGDLSDINKFANKIRKLQKQKDFDIRNNGLLGLAYIAFNTYNGNYYKNYPKYNFVQVLSIVQYALSSDEEIGDYKKLAQILRGNNYDARNRYDTFVKDHSENIHLNYFVTRKATSIIFTPVGEIRDMLKLPGIVYEITGNDEILEWFPKEGDKKATIPVGATMEAKVIGVYKGEKMTALIAVNPLSKKGISIFPLSYKKGVDFNKARDNVFKDQENIKWLDSPIPLKGTTKLRYKERGVSKTMDTYEPYDLLYIKMLQDSRIMEKMPLPERITEKTLDEYLTNNIKQEDGYWIYRGIAFATKEEAQYFATLDFKKQRLIGNDVLAKIKNTLGNEYGLRDRTVFVELRRLDKAIGERFATYYNRLARIAGYMATKTIFPAKDLGKKLRVRSMNKWYEEQIKDKNLLEEGVTADDNDVVFIPPVNNFMASDKDIEQMEKAFVKAVENGVKVFILPKPRMLSGIDTGKAQAFVNRATAILQNAGYQVFFDERSDALIYIHSGISESRAFEEAVPFEKVTWLLPYHIVKRGENKFGQVSDKSAGLFIYNFLQNATDQPLNKRTKHLEAKHKSSEDIVENKEFINKTISAVVRRLYGKDTRVDVKSSILLNFYEQVKNADAVVIVSPILRPGTKATGKTSYVRTPTTSFDTAMRAELAKQMKKPLYVIDAGRTNRIYKWNAEAGDFVEVRTIPMKKNMLGLMSNELYHIAGHSDVFYSILAELGIGFAKGEIDKETLDFIDEIYGELFNEPEFKDGKVVKNGSLVIARDELARIIEVNRNKDLVKLRILSGEHAGKVRDMRLSNVLPSVINMKINLSLERKIVDEVTGEEQMVEYKVPYIVSIAPDMVRGYKIEETEGVRVGGDPLLRFGSLKLDVMPLKKPKTFERLYKQVHDALIMQSANMSIKDNDKNCKL